MTTHAHRVMTSSLDPCWRTPERLFEVLNEEFAFGLDAAASREDALCGMFLGPGSDLAEDALSVDWGLYAQGRAVWCNPPFSMELYRATRNPAMLIDNWVAKMAHTAIDGGITVVGCIPHAPQTKRWRQFVEGHQDRAAWAADAPIYRATEIRLFESRVKFRPSTQYQGTASGANGNTAIVVWQPYRQGQFVEPWSPLVRYMRY